MYKIMISCKLASMLRGGFQKQAAAWDDLSYDAQAEYLKNHPGSKKRITKRPGEGGKSLKDYDRMSVPEIQAAIKEYQMTKSPRSFKALYKNFLPMVLNTVKRVIGPRQVSKDDVEDLKQDANIIFVRALSNADPANQGVIKYFQDTLQKQLEGKSRDIFRPTVTIGPKDKRLLRAVRRYLHEQKGNKPIDYADMARAINSDPTNRITHATPELITSLLQTPGVSLEEEVGGEGESKRKIHDVLGPSGVLDTDDRSYIETPEEETIQQDIKNVVSKSIEALDNPLRRKLLKLKFGLEPIKVRLKPTKEYPEGQIVLAQGKQLDVKDIAKIVNLSRSTVRRELEKAMVQMRRMQDIQRLDKSSKSAMRIIKAFDGHIRFEYQPQSISKVGHTYIIDGIVVKKFGSQLVCNCGKTNCFHKDAVKNI